MTDDKMKELAQKLAHSIRAVANRVRTEEELRIGLAPCLEEAVRELAPSLAVEYEKRTLLKGSADAVLGHLWMEYERPGRLASKSGINQARRQLARYLMAEASRYRKGREEALRKMVGLATDGQKIFYLRYGPRSKGSSGPRGVQLALLEEAFLAGEFRQEGPFEITPEAISRFLIYLRALGRRPLTPENLAQEFGPKSRQGSGLAGQTIGAFCQKLMAGSHPQVTTLFKEWERLFGIIYGQETARAEEEALGLARLYGLKQKAGLKPLLFSVHTYYALLMKLIAVELASLQSGSLVSSFIADLPALPGPELKERLTSLEQGAVFSQLGINNFLEGDFFGWYLAGWDDDMAEAIREMAARLSDFEPATTTLEPEGTRDLLKKLYQYLVPKKLRHDLGEYYTPDWLAELVLNRVKYYGNPDYRLIDPGCGSGTFLVLAIKRIKEYAQENPLSPRSLLEKILANVVGFDLNPLAVIAARTNYLLALGDLLRYKRPLDIPVYLCDSILTPAQYAQLFGTGYRVPTVVGDFVIPEEIIEKGKMARLAILLEECARADYSEEEFLRRACPALEVDKKATESMLGDLYAMILKLEKQGKNRIWTRLLKNNFAPIFVGEFDYVVGNPPWVNWESLSTEYRKATQGLWQKYGLFSLKGQAARMGGGKKDLAMLFTYAALDNYAQPNGRLGFVITQTVFKTKGAGDGFRRFRLAPGSPLKVVSVDDLVALQPFEGAANRTALLCCQVGQETKYPVNYTLWRKREPAGILPDAALNQVVAGTRRALLQARPVDKRQASSPWMTARPRALKAVERLLGKAAYTARAGCCTWANGVYWLKCLSPVPDGSLLVENLADEGKQHFRSVQVAIEADLAHPLLRGRDVGRWRASPSAYILMVQDPEKRRGYDEAWLKQNYPKSYLYLKSFEAILKKRPGYLKYFQAGAAPFYSMYNVGSYTFAPVKVVWREQAAFLTAAVIREQEGRPVMPDHKLMLVPFQEPVEAHFLCALLNSGISQLIAKAYVVETATSTHILEHIAIPRFDAGQAEHQALAGLSQKAHHLASREDNRAKEELAQLEEEIDLAAAELWDITPEELVEIKRSLKELG